VRAEIRRIGCCEHIHCSLGALWRNGMSSGGLAKAHPPIDGAAQYGSPLPAPPQFHSTQHIRSS
jgi:hypothetical protein